jgi:hypothetical protein
MKLWFQIVICVGIVSVSAASLSYTWQTWRSYTLEHNAREACEILHQETLPAGDREAAADYWRRLRGCINEILGRNLEHAENAFSG